MTLIRNPFGSLTGSNFLAAVRHHRGTFVCPGCPYIKFHNCLFPVPDEFAELFDDINQKPTAIFDIPSERHPLHLLWNCFFHRLCQESLGFVYAIRCQEYVKVGITTDLKARLGQYRTENPYPMRLLLAEKVYGYTQIEKEIHDYFRPLHHRGEWFRLGHKSIRLIRKALSYLDVGESEGDEWSHLREMRSPRLIDLLDRCDPRRIRPEDLPF